ncbi:MAG: hypothetical protein ACXAB2_04790, partial [Candidatus Hodarchaeales archaeon]
LCLFLILSGFFSLSLSTYYDSYLSPSSKTPSIGTSLSRWPVTTDGINRPIYPRLVDLNQDNQLELIVVTGNGSVYICDEKGVKTPTWPKNYLTPTTIWFFPDSLISDFFPSTEGLEIGLYQVLANQTALFLIIDLEGNILGEWAFHNMTAPSRPLLLSRYYAFPIVCFWNENANSTSQIFILNLWDPFMTAQGFLIDPYASLTFATSFFAPYSKSSHLLFLSSANNIYHVNSQGDILYNWTHPLINQSSSCSLFVTGFTYQDNPLIFYTSDSGQLLAWDLQGVEIPSWNQIPENDHFNFSTSSSEYYVMGTFPIAADLDGDNIRELVTSWTWLNDRLEWRNRLIITFQADGTFSSNNVLYFENELSSYSPFIADFNRDSSFDFLLFGRYGGFTFLSSDGSVIPEYEDFPAMEIHRTVLLGDLTGDNFCELFLTTPWGAIYAFQTQVVGRSIVTESLKLHTKTDFWDRDYDGLLDQDEIFWGTNPLLNDTDSDGHSDLVELGILFTSPFRAPTLLETLFLDLLVPISKTFGRLFFAVGLMGLLTVLTRSCFRKSNLR